VTMRGWAARAAVGLMVAGGGCGSSSRSATAVEKTYCGTLGRIVTADHDSLEVAIFARLPTTGMGPSFDAETGTLHRIGAMLLQKRPLTAAERSTAEIDVDDVTTRCSFQEPRNVWPNI
jgi:hypothetical protein